MLDPIIDPVQLQRTPAALLFDCRPGPQGHAAYLAGHMPGAVHVDLDRDLAAPAPHPERGGRHPLPDGERFAELLSRWGVSPNAQLVAYDDQGGANAAARFWWMLRSLGHENVRVLDGGLQAAVAAGFTLETGPVMRPSAAPYPKRTFTWKTADLTEVDRVRTLASHRVLDVRAAFRYRGESEPIDPVAGHIPGAQNMPFSENLREGRFKPAAELRRMYEEALAGVSTDHLIVHCGSGVTACHSLLALERAGLTGAKLYVGSWGEWCRNTALPRSP